MKRSLLALLTAIVLLSASTVSFACACCADRGTYWISTSVPDAYTLGLLKDMHMEAGVELYMSEGEDEMKGIGDLGWENLSLVDAYTNNTWKISITSAAGKTGTLTLPRPAKMTSKKIDLREKEEGDPVLYKEYSFSGVVGSGSGVFKSGIVRTTKYTLVFQGRGNFCDNVEDFTHWRLEVTGSKADYAFFGKMKKGS